MLPQAFWHWRTYSSADPTDSEGHFDAVQGTLLPAIDNPELKALVVTVAPAFEAHRKMAIELEKKIPGVTAGEQASAR